MTPDHGAEQGTASFAERLRSRRMAAGLTQAELAARAGVGVRTVRDLERGRSSRPQRTTLELLAGALDLAGAERAGFIAAGRRGTSAPAGETWSVPGPRAPADIPAGAGGAGGGTRTGRLPAPDELVGRDGEVADLVALVTGGVRSATTLVGLAGVGKTALALTVAHRAAPALTGGVAGVAVTAGSSDADALTAIATVFGVARAADLADRLAGAPALLLVDAVERSPDAIRTALERLARVAPTLRVLATGRHAVGLVGERVWPVAPLEVPPPDVADPAAIERFPAAALFLARLRQVRRGPLEPDELRTVGALVRRLGGLPLAIELAAARGRVLDVTEILTRYGHRVLDLTSLAGGPDTISVDLRAAVSASYDLLTPQEQAGLRRLSAFRNRWSVELAEAMLAERDEGARAADPVPLLDRLLALGLVSARGPGPLRFRLVDVVRDFATEQAAATGDLAAIRVQHARVFAGLAGRTAPELAGAAVGPAIARLDEVTGDLWAALAASADDDPETALALAASLPRWWRFHGRDVVGRRWLRRLVDDRRTADAHPAMLAWARVGLAQLAAEHGEGPQELPEAQAALAAFQQLGDVSGELAARTVLCSLHIATGGYDEARRHGEAALSLATRTGRVRDMIVAQTNLTWHEIRVGDLPSARRRLAAVERLSGQIGDNRLRLLARANLAEVARLDRRYAEAVSLGRQAVRGLAGLGDPGHRLRVLGTIGLALAQDGRLAEAEGVLRELRATRDGTARGRSGAPHEDAPYAAIEATNALHRGDRDLAAERFGVAAEAYGGTRDLRDVAEALVGLVASTEEPVARAAVVDRLGRVCRAGGITLLPDEQVVVGPLPLPDEAGGAADHPA